MLGDISKAEHIYLVCGYTDIRKSIDGLSAIVQQNFRFDFFPIVCFCSVDANGTASKLSSGKMMALSHFIRGLRMERSSAKKTG